MESGPDQSAPLICDPMTGAPLAGEWTADGIRLSFRSAAFLFHPWTGRRRDAFEVGADPFGLLIVPGADNRPVFTLTKRQADTLKFIAEFQHKNGFPPTPKEIGEALFVSASAIDFRLRGLIAKGCIERIRGVARGLRIVDCRVIVKSKGIDHES